MIIRITDYYSLITQALILSKYDIAVKNYRETRIFIAFKIIIASSAL